MLGMKKAALIILCVLLLASTNALFADEVTISVTIPKSTRINVSQNAFSQFDELFLSSNGYISLTIQASDGTTESIETSERSLIIPFDRSSVSSAKRYTYTVM